MKDNSVEENLKKLQKIETKLNTSYVEGTLRSIAMLIPLMEKGNEELYFPDLKRKKNLKILRNTVLLKRFPNLIEKEKNIFMSSFIRFESFNEYNGCI